MKTLYFSAFSFSDDLFHPHGGILKTENFMLYLRIIFN